MGCNPEGLMKTVTKQDLAKMLYEESKVFKNVQASSDFVNIFFQEIMHSLASGNDVKLPPLGNFEVKYKKSRIGRNPRTKEDAIIPARKVVKLKISNSFRSMLQKTIIKVKV
jgi:integration host factor subunit alpha